jgi:hypothetical protein
MKLITRQLAPFALVAPLLLGGACSKQPSECDKISAVATASVKEMHRLEARIRAEAHEASALSKDAQAFTSVIEKTVEELRAVEIKTDALKGHVDAYTKMLEATAAATKGLLGALEDAAELSDARLVEAQKSMAAAQAGLVSSCGGDEKPADCDKIAAVMQRFTDAPPSGPEMSAGLVAHAEELEKIELESAEIKAAKLAYTAVLREFSALFAIAAKLDAKVEEVNIAVQNEDALVEAINAHCRAE